MNITFIQLSYGKEECFLIPHPRIFLMISLFRFSSFDAAVPYPGNVLRI